MSGIEIIGIVLGTIPLVISALEHYQDTRQVVSTWRRHVRVTQSLMRNLQTEHGKLYNTCETLLGGIVPSTMLLPMLKEPFGSLWQNDDVRERIEQRLDHMYYVFAENVKDMLATIEQLKSNLGIDAHAKMDSFTGSSIKRNLIKASLVINRSSYEEALQKLISQNQTLETIVVGSLRLEPSRRKRSQAIFFVLFQRILSSLYRALQYSLREACTQNHGAQLQLSTPCPAIRSDDETSIIRGMNFCVILSHFSPELSGACYQDSTWTGIRLQVAALHDALKRTISRTGGVPAGGKPVKRVKFADPSNDNTSHSNPIDLTPLAVGSRPSIGRLCGAVPTTNGDPNLQQCVMDPSDSKYGRFDVHPLQDNCIPTGLSFMSIRDAMERAQCRPSLPQKLTLASEIALGILQLHNTPWLSKGLTNRDIYLALRHGVVDFEHGFVNRTLPNDTQTTGLQRKGSDNELMWALLLLLIEVILWRPVEHVLFGVRIDQGLTLPPDPSKLFDYTTEGGYARVQAVLDKVTMAGDTEYRGAVECCLKLAFGYPNLDLDREEFRQQIYGNVVMPIGESAKSAQTLIITTGGSGCTYY